MHSSGMTVLIVLAGLYGFGLVLIWAVYGFLAVAFAYHGDFWPLLRKGFWQGLRWPWLVSRLALMPDEGA